MNASEHRTAGLISGVTAYLWICSQMGISPSLRGLFLVGTLSIPASLLPDLLEPATHPNHRGLCHSHLAVLGGLKLVQDLWRNPSIPVEDKAIFTALAIATLSHLALDATTAKSLPLVGIRL